MGKIATATDFPRRAGTEPSASNDARDDASETEPRTADFDVFDAARADTHDTVRDTRTRVSRTTYPRSLAREVLTGDRYVAVARAADSSASVDEATETAADAFGVHSRGASLVAELDGLGFRDSSEEEEDARLGARVSSSHENVLLRVLLRIRAKTRKRKTRKRSLGERRMRAARLEKRLRKRPSAPRASASVTAERDTQRRACKLPIESDRLAAAREAGYRTWLAGMHPGECTPKNDVLVGVFADSRTRRRRRRRRGPRRVGVCWKNTKRGWGS